MSGDLEGSEPRHTYDSRLESTRRQPGIRAPVIAIDEFQIPLSAGMVIAYVTGVAFGLKLQRRGPAVSWALAGGLLYWGIAPGFVSLSAMKGNVVAEWLVRFANPFTVLYDAFMGDVTTAAIGATLLVVVAAGGLAALGLAFGRLAGRVE